MFVRAFYHLSKGRGSLWFAMTENLNIHAFEQRSELAKKKLKILHQHMIKIQTDLISAEEKRLKLQNQQLLNKVASLKEKLDRAEKANGQEEIKLNKVACTVASEGQPPKVATPNTEKPAAKGQEKKQKEKPKEAKKPKQPKIQEAAPVDVSRLDMRVALIKTVKNHPDADALYVEEMDVGEESFRTVVTGIRKHVPIEQMENRLVILMCNLKPAKMRGILSQAMVMCANCPEKIEIIDPPADSVPGDRIVFEGYPGKPDAQLNPKKKVFERIQPDLHTNDQCIACYKGVPFTVEGKGICKVQSLKNCGIK